MSHQPNEHSVRRIVLPSGRKIDVIRFGADVLTGIPSILIGLFAYAVIVAHTHFSAYSASVALAVLMLPKPETSSANVQECPAE